ncbi:pyroglutamyl-peptidase I [Halalkalibacillus halophilus]|uniref:pyroglutamyl-peptidase I n=1 Tax=Halalkalibacillus halophilus TaxID=392827 RepID=UPI000426D084|nr:pyroglutamyl-peptidase I [Halalkalibacillus halophilus]
MKKLLLTSFEPFLDFKVNPTMEISKALDGQVFGEYKVVSRTLSVDFSSSGKELLQAIDQEKPDAIISLGLAGGRNRITPERIAVNCNDGGAADNTGYIPGGEKIEENGPDGIFSSLPIRDMVTKLKEAGFPAAISDSAGTYLCNNVMYQGLTYAKSQSPEIPSGFIHIPASHEIAVTQSNLSSWSQQDLIQSIRVCLSCM